MAELFRYIEQSFVIPLDRAAIDAGNSSDLQQSLRREISNQVPSERIRGIARDFVLKHFRSPVADPFQLGKQARSFDNQLLALPKPAKSDIDALVSKVFGSKASPLVGSDSFLADKALLDDILVCVKITTGFDRVNARELVTMRQVFAFIEDFAADRIADFSAKGIRAVLRRPVRIPNEFVDSLKVIAENPAPVPPPSPQDDAAARQRSALMAEQRNLKHVYEAIMRLPADQFELKAVSRRTQTEESSHAREESGAADPASAPPTFLAIPRTAIERLGDDARRALESANINAAEAPVTHVIMAIKKRWQEVSQQLAPYQVPAPKKVFRVGVHLFVVNDATRAER